MELVAHRRLSKQALIDLVFFCGLPIVLAMLSAILGPYAVVMGAAGAGVYVLLLAIVPWWLTCLVTQRLIKTAGRILPLSGGHRCQQPPALRVAVRVCQFGRGDIWPALTPCCRRRSARHIKSAACPKGAIVLGSFRRHSMRRWLRVCAANQGSGSKTAQLSGAETAEDDALLRSLIGSGVAASHRAGNEANGRGIRARTAVGPSNNCLSGVSAD